MSHAHEGNAEERVDAEVDRGPEAERLVEAELPDLRKQRISLDAGGLQERVPW